MPYPHFEWKPVVASQRYRIQIARDAAFRRLVNEDAVHAVIQWYVTAKALEKNGYFWRVRAEKEDGTAGLWSGPRQLRVVEPAKIFLLTPAMPLAEVRGVAQQAATFSSACIRFQKGKYRWDPGYEGAVFDWSGAHDIVVEGNGAEVSLLDPSAQAFNLRDCSRVVIRGLTLHHEPTPYSALEVLAVAPDGAWLDARVLAGFAEERYPRKVNQFFIYAVQPGNFLKKHPERPGHTYMAWDKTARIGDGRFRFFPRDERERGSLRQLKPRDQALVCYRRWPLNWMTGCRDVTWSKIAGGISEGALFMGGDNQDIKFLGLVSRRHNKYFPTAGGWVTGNDRRGPWIEGCLWEGMTDDGPNITGNSYMLDAVLGPSECVVSTGPGWQTSAWLPGDEIIFWNPLTGAPLLTTRVARSERVCDGPWKGKQRVSMTDPLPTVSAGRDPHRNTHVYNLSTQNQQLVIRRNQLVGGRRFGFNIKANSALIERNRFDGQASCAVYLENEPSGWEGLVNRNIVVQDNTIIGCGYDVHSRRLQRANIHVNTWRNNPVMAEADWIGNRDILIRRNTILDWEGVAIGVDNAENVTIADNRIGSRHSRAFIGGTNVAIKVFGHTRNIVVQDNKITDTRAGCVPLVTLE